MARVIQRQLAGYIAVRLVILFFGLAATSIVVITANASHAMS